MGNLTVSSRRKGRNNPRIVLMKGVPKLTRACRHALGLTLKEAARELGMHDSLIGNRESGLWVFADEDAEKKFALPWLKAFERRGFTIAPTDREFKNMSTDELLERLALALYAYKKRGVFDPELIRAKFDELGLDPFIEAVCDMQRTPEPRQTVLP